MTPIRNLRPGTWDIYVELYDAAGLLATGTGTVEVVLGTTSEAKIDITLGGDVEIVVSWSSASTVIMETWNDGESGDWIGNTIFTTVEIKNTGGNPDGYLHSTGTGGYVGATNHSSEYSGNFTDAGIRETKFDLYCISGVFTVVYLRHRYLDARYNGWKLPVALDSSSGWHSYSVIFDPTWDDAEAIAAGWEQEDGSASFSDTMSNVYTTEIRLNGNGEVGIDNFIVAVQM